MNPRSSWVAVLIALGPAGCAPSPPDTLDFSPVSRVATGRPVAVMLTAYSTTLRANGSDWTRLRVAVSDSLSREITSATDSIRVYLTGDGSITTAEGQPLPLVADTGGTRYAAVVLRGGIAQLGFRAGTAPGRAKVEARSANLFPGGHEIHAIPADVRLMTPTPDQLHPTAKPIGRMIGADISWLPEIENGAGRFAQGIRQFRENGMPVDAVALLKRHGFNTIRLRIFVNPENPAGYSPGTGFCGLDSTLSMARRAKAAGLELLLDFHYSDYWADPQQQHKPLAWAGLDYAALRDTVRSYTSSVLRAFRDQGTLPDMVQIGNEVNHGLLWPEGHIGNLDQLAGLLQAGVEGTEAVDPGIPVMMHIALGGQNEEARFWLDNMIARGVRFDVIGLSYYPRWHGTLEDLSVNLNDLIARYRKPVNVVEYSDFRRPVHDIVFGLPGDLGRGAAIWEPLNWRSGLFDREGRVTDQMQVYDSLNAEYLAPAGTGGVRQPVTPAGPDTIPGTGWTTEDWRIVETKVRWAVGQGLDTLPVGPAIARLGETFVGTTYTPGTLEVPGPEQLVVNLRELDCVTFVENLLALTRFVRHDGVALLSDPPAARARYEGYLTDLRYRDSQLNGYPSRLHYFSEWLADNARRGQLRLLSRDLGGVPDPEPIRFMSDHPGSYRQLAEPAVLDTIKRIEVGLSRAPRYVIPKDRIRAVADRIEDGDVIAATSSLPGLDVAHTGIALWRNGELHLLHAPLVGKSVEISARPLAERIAGIATQDGIMVGRVLDRR